MDIKGAKGNINRVKLITLVGISKMKAKKNTQKTIKKNISINITSEKSAKQITTPKNKC